ncbi:hypothetical protein [Massilia sp. Root418]|uniref:hypothetical protein n=1 Tax=Massilia sp. Root418 TaxID=1736532 RepID=UPI0012F6327C|nr:hypothetical protein [Massilia sp. Root418]
MHAEGSPGSAERKALPFPQEDKLLALADCDGHALPVEPIGLHAARAVLQALRDGAPGLDCDENTFLCLRYGETAHVACVSRQAAEQGGSEVLLKQRSLLGAVATRAKGEEAYRVSHLLVAEPVAGLACSVHVMVQQCSGDVVMAGWGELAHGQLLFHLHAVKRPGAVPLAIAGCLGGGHLDLTHAAAGSPDAVH